jgi:hypothetical protein
MPNNQNEFPVVSQKGNERPIITPSTGDYPLYALADGTTARGNVATATGTVTSVGLSAPSYFTVSGSPVTGTGTLTFTGATLAQGLFLASPSSGSGPLAPRAITATDIASAISSGVYLQKAQNLADVDSILTSRANIKIESRQTFSNANVTVLPATTVAEQIGTMSASRTVTLPLANSVNPGKELLIIDGSGTASISNSIVLAASGSDTIIGNQSIIAPNGSVSLVSDGTGNWIVFSYTTASGSYLTVAGNLSDLSSVLLARQNMKIESRQTFNNANVTALSATTILEQIGTLSAARVVTLPLANSVNPGKMLLVLDTSGTASSTNTISLVASGSDTIGGNSPIVAPRGLLVLISDGTSKWDLAWGNGVSSTNSFHMQIGCLSAAGNASSIMCYNSVFAWSLPTNLGITTVANNVKVYTYAAISEVYTLRHNGTSIGTITIGTSTVTVSVTATDFAIGDNFDCIAPASASNAAVFVATFLPTRTS